MTTAKRIPIHIVYYTPGLVCLNHSAGPSEARELSYTGLLLRYQLRHNAISTDGMHGCMHSNGLVIYGVRGNTRSNSQVMCVWFISITDKCD